MSATDPPERGGEHDAIARWIARLPGQPGLAVGPGDDAAWLDGFALSVDTVVEGVHFRLDWCSPADAGWKAVAAALSDLAASRAAPRAALVSLAVPASELSPGGLADGFMEGVTEACGAFSCPLAGGDVVHTDGPCQIAVTVVGDGLGDPLLRSGAAPGDRVLLSGPTGWAALGVQSLSRGLPAPPRALAAHRRPRPRLDLLDALADATAGIDVSDGLLADAARVARASGCSLRLDRDACLAGGPPEPALTLSGGEDYELLVTAPAVLPGFRVIGEVAAGDADVVWADGRRIPHEGRGWDHGERA